MTAGVTAVGWVGRDEDGGACGPDESQGCFRGTMMEAEVVWCR